MKVVSQSTQTDSPPLAIFPGHEVCLNNNNSSASLSALSISTQTCMETSNSPAFISSKEGSCIAQSFECLVCREKFDTASLLSEHADAEHELSIDAEKLSDPKTILS